MGGDLYIFEMNNMHVLLHKNRVLVKFYTKPAVFYYK